MADAVASSMLAEAAARGEKWVHVAGREAQPAKEFTCAGCEKPIPGPLAYAPSLASATGTLATEADAKELYCDACRQTHLGPLCRGCGLPAPRKIALIAADAWWHRGCLRCTEPSCRMLLGDQYWVHERRPYCAEHHAALTAEPCATCGMPVGEGLRALGQAWHEGCLQCATSGAKLDEGTIYIHQGRTYSEAGLKEASSTCAACGEAALTDRIFAMGKLYHKECFRCAHCRSEVGTRRFVEVDGEPYLDGCYQKVFGAAAGPEMQAAARGDVKRYAVHVPVAMTALGAALDAFTERQAREIRGGVYLQNLAEILAKLLADASPGLPRRRRCCRPSNARCARRASSTSASSSSRRPR